MVSPVISGMAGIGLPSVTPDRSTILDTPLRIKVIVSMAASGRTPPALRNAAGSKSSGGKSPEYCVDFCDRSSASRTFIVTIAELNNVWH